MFEEKFELYESLNFEEVHSSILPYLKVLSGTIVDIGSGSGRDAAALAELGFKVIAIEPSEELLGRASRLHAHDNIQWVHGSLPILPNSLEHETVDAVMLSAVWMYIPSTDQEKSLESIYSILKKGGVLFLSVRNKRPNDDNNFVDTNLDEISRLLVAKGFKINASFVKKDHLNRVDIRWHVLVCSKEAL